MDNLEINTCYADSVKSISDIIAETSYLDKTYEQCEHNIREWLKKVPTLKLSNQDKEFVIYILESRYQNIEVLKEHFQRECHLRQKTKDNIDCKAPVSPIDRR